jgi:hypothetical protein
MDGAERRAATTQVKAACAKPTRAIDLVGSGAAVIHRFSKAELIEFSGKLEG